MNTQGLEHRDNMHLNARSEPELDLVAQLAARLGNAREMPLRPKDQALLEGAEAFKFGPDDSRIAWSVGKGPLVILVHGYSGRGVQVAKLALEVAGKGHQCVFFDAGGHGDSRAEKIGFFTFMNDTRDVVRHFDTPVYALIGHSAGALGMMHARNLYGVSAQKYGVICAPLYPYVPLENLRLAGAPEQSITYIKAILSDQFQTSWSSMVSGISFQVDEGKPLLAVYDLDDKMVNHEDAEALRQLWPDTTIVKTEGYGHNKILQAPETIKAVLEFLDQ